MPAQQQKWLNLFMKVLPLSLLFLLTGCSERFVLLNPKGPVAEVQKDLILWSIWFMLFIIVVIFVLFAIILWKYRERPENLDYEPPDQHGNTLLEIIWTAIPVLIVIALAIPTIKATFELEKPPKESRGVEPIVIHATAADWKWIFSYPEENIETVNYVNIPKDVPVEFKLTAVGGMSALWIPELGGQKYNMAGMGMTLYLQADHVGTFKGRNSNFTGEGFAHQTFDVNAMEKEDFYKWVKETQASAPLLTKKQFNEIIQVGVLKDKLTFSGTHLAWVDFAKPGEHLDNIPAKEKHGTIKLEEVESDHHDNREHESHQHEGH
ncbi:cytochrome aa3 quinol oxidase subunit II [Aeribacillus composti]|jgi:cytochrome aa3-600 menaquinol oxidase subunit II|uniref:Quinol oxidase subunit 2 n=1 Tax=Aeribacillus composti TaxID=1868734 RepID=A0ABY9WB09_9BACI|nr:MULTISPECIES: cytochrome aa3 quinol oxidase subunit II [Aeribacillus]MED0716700.1 cytochrome aa3 quinol oxidase subunit II [Aeribacillus composti]MED0745015.1 cytochrome aa3 quinol oxidase subunit II [Aeribacillus composti]MED1441359.1 cytochrome aa3 quinol oxidase subunit II [Aeribacillus composti]WNF33060.1 cytochrome aa3 quinol oxidase subunit II [Aeribacillus composti]BBU41304.1 quinol oxidase subunit 2 [Aeribacillus pallidus]